jgi:hypothetical protein
MKYGKTWKTWLSNEGMNANYEYILSYSRWKKEIVHAPEQLILNITWQQELEKECKRVDHSLFRSSSLMICGRTPRVSPQIKSELCQWNAKTLYKICKKLQKKLQVPAMAWYTRTLAHHTFHFAGSARSAFLLHQLNPSETSCPICMEGGGETRTWIFQRCGHVLCKDCVVKYFALHRMKGTLYNLLAHVNPIATCPLCRMKYPFDQCIITKV